jgi:hypothetical protein
LSVQPSWRRSTMSDSETRQHHLHRWGAGLRLIVPLAAGEDYRSWLGGCPHLPDPFSWPQRDGKPLHFLGQIDCAALPRGIWGDLAREPVGWRSSSGWRQGLVQRPFLAGPVRRRRHGRGAPRGGAALRIAQSGAGATGGAGAGLAVVEYISASARQGRRRHRAGAGPGPFSRFRRPPGQRVRSRSVRPAARRGEHRPAARRRSLSEPARAIDQTFPQAGQTRAEAVRCGGG